MPPTAACEHRSEVFPVDVALLHGVLSASCRSPVFWHEHASLTESLVVDRTPHGVNPRVAAPLFTRSEQTFYVAPSVAITERQPLVHL